MKDQISILLICATAIIVIAAMGHTDIRVAQERTKCVSVMTKTGGFKAAEIGRVCK